VSVKNAAAFALGVQWHPEYWVTTDAPSRALFAAFGDAVRKRMAMRTGLSTAAE
jgi:putative glutamine amidotransferase